MLTSDVASQESPWNVNPRPVGASRYEWDGGVFETARRSFTENVEGTIAPSNHLVMATLRGGAERTEIVNADGGRYQGPDRAGSVSFLPAHCERRLRLRGVAWEWASISLKTSVLAGYEAPGSQGSSVLPAFSNQTDPFLVGMLSEMERLLREDGSLDLIYCDAMVAAVGQYLLKRNHVARPDAPSSGYRLTKWQMGRVEDFVAANLHREIRIASLAAVLGLSEGHFHRSFRMTTGCTPLHYVNERRVRRALRILESEPWTSIADVALQVGFGSPSYFTRIFRSVTGQNPSQWLAQRAV